MAFEFTPASERALATAASWTSCDDRDGLRLPEVLLGLLSEPECRAALLAAAFGVDEAAVRRRFPQLRALDQVEHARAARFSPQWLACLEEAENRLFEYPRPLALATEHLLLGIVATENEVSAWLAECGLYADALEAEVHRLAGHQSGPLPIDIADDGGTWIAVTQPPPEEPPIESGREIGTAMGETGFPREDEWIGVLRVIDAAANRAGEGLRVAEDYLRFVLDDRHLTEVCKTIRHELTAALAVFPPSQRHAARDTRADVGIELTLDSQRSHAGLAATVAANFKRVEQALRSLEEFAKLTDADAAAALGQLRYRVYTLERATDVTRTSTERLAAARLYVLVDGRQSAEEFGELVEALVSAGVSIIQLRDKQLDDRRLVERARRLRAATAGTSTLFIMNDRPDLAVLAGADGVHVGQEELSVKDARRIVGPSALLGVSTHSIQQARSAVLDGANYIGVGPTFPSGTKAFAAFTGIELLRAVQAEIRLPAFAIGGVTAANLPQVLASGFRRVAVSGAVTAADDPAAAARELLAALAD